MYATKAVAGRQISAYWESYHNADFDRRDCTAAEDWTLEQVASAFNELYRGGRYENSVCLAVKEYVEAELLREEARPLVELFYQVPDGTRMGPGHLWDGGEEKAYWELLPAALRPFGPSVSFPRVLRVLESTLAGGGQPDILSQLDHRLPLRRVLHIDGADQGAESITPGPHVEGLFWVAVAAAPASVAVFPVFGRFDARVKVWDIDHGFGAEPRPHVWTRENPYDYNSPGVLRDRVQTVAFKWQGPEQSGSRSLDGHRTQLALRRQPSFLCRWDAGACMNGTFHTMPKTFVRLTNTVIQLARLNDRDMENTREGRVVCWGTRRQPLEPYLDRETARTVAMVDGGIGYVLDVQVLVYEGGGTAATPVMQAAAAARAAKRAARRAPQLAATAATAAAAAKGAAEGEAAAPDAGECAAQGAAAAAAAADAGAAAARTRSRARALDKARASGAAAVAEVDGAAVGAVDAAGAAGEAGAACEGAAPGRLLWVVLPDTCAECHLPIVEGGAPTAMCDCCDDSVHCHCAGLPPEGPADLEQARANATGEHGDVLMDWVCRRCEEQLSSSQSEGGEQRQQRPARGQQAKVQGQQPAHAAEAGSQPPAPAAAGGAGARKPQPGAAGAAAGTTAAGGAEAADPAQAQQQLDAYHAAQAPHNLDPNQDSVARAEELLQIQIAIQEQDQQSWLEDQQWMAWGLPGPDLAQEAGLSWLHGQAPAPGHAQAGPLQAGPSQPQPPQQCQPPRLPALEGHPLSSPSASSASSASDDDDGSAQGGRKRRRRRNVPPRSRQARKRDLRLVAEDLIERVLARTAGNSGGDDEEEEDSAGAQGLGGPAGPLLLLNRPLAGEGDVGAPGGSNDAAPRGVRPQSQPPPGVTPQHWMLAPTFYRLPVAEVQRYCDVLLQDRLGRLWPPAPNTPERWVHAHSFARHVERSVLSLLRFDAALRRGDFASHGFPAIPPAAPPVPGTSARTSVGVASVVKPGKGQGASILRVLNGREST
eukprot:XP_001693056.1 predicted protein [Chlamydomonas reinhardtii]